MISFKHSRYIWGSQRPGDRPYRCRPPRRGPGTFRGLSSRNNREFVLKFVSGGMWADVYCPGCHAGRGIALRTIDRHPVASFGSLVLGYGAADAKVQRRCRRSPACRPCRPPPWSLVRWPAGAIMALWWLSFRTRYVPAGAAIVDATSLEHARMLAAIAGFDAGLTFTSGHVLDDGQAAMVAQGEIGRLLLLDEAVQVRTRIEGQS
jgi:hypothetical protein